MFRHLPQKYPFPVLKTVEFLHCGHSRFTRFTSIGMHEFRLFSTKETWSIYLCKPCKTKPRIVASGSLKGAGNGLNIIKNSGKRYNVISETTRSFIDSLVDYYTSEAASYMQMANSYSDIVREPSDAAFGIIVGSIYSAFIQSYTNQQQKPSLEDIQEFSQIIRKRAPQIKRSILDARS